MSKNAIAPKSSATRVFLRCASIPMLVFSSASVLVSSVQAQVMTPALDGTNTRIVQDGNTFNIAGGTQSGANLFHSFQQFGLNQGQVANFLSNPATQNILSRVTGGNPSLIQGVIQVSGSNANLYLMNPAGMVFGANASLNVPGSFTATTASGIGLGNHWFNATGPNNYSALTGAPGAFAFTASQPGAIVNAGNLAVNLRQNLSLLGGTVVNTGTLSAPEGTITVMAVPGDKLLRVGQTGSLLSLDLPLQVKNQVNPLAITPLSLPQLLTGANTVGNATGLRVENGVVRLVGSGATVYSQPGDVTVSRSLNVSGAVGGKVQVLGDRVNLRAATINASGFGGGGQVLVGGDFRGQGTIPTAKRTFISADSLINVSARDRGNAGRAIVWANEATGFSGRILATGGRFGGDGGFVEVSGKENLAFDGRVDVSAPNGNSGTLLLDPRNIVIQNAGVDDNQLDADAPNVGDPSGQILAGDGGNGDFTLSASVLQSQSGTVRLEATENITIVDGVSLSFSNNTDVTFIADADGNGSGSFSMSPTDSMNLFNGSLTISGANVEFGQVGQFNQATTGAVNVTLTATNGNITTGTMIVNGGDGRNIVTLTAPQGSITLNGLIQAGDMNNDVNVPAPGREGQINITARQFRAINPQPVLNNEFVEEQVSLYAFPAEQGKGINDLIVPLPLRGQFSLQFDVPGYESTPQLVGTGPTLITIRLLEDISFTHNVALSSSGSGTEGKISVGTGFAPNAVVLLQDNLFAASLAPPIEPPGPGIVPAVVVLQDNLFATSLVPTETPVGDATVATVLNRREQRTSETVLDCDPGGTSSEILDVSAVVALGSPGSTRGGSSARGLPPCGEKRE